MTTAGDPSIATVRRPESVLVVVYTPDGSALLLKRCHPYDFWQSVTGSLWPDENHAQAAARELEEETGLRDEGELSFSGIQRSFVIDPRWRHRYGPGVTVNLEYEWRYRLSEPRDIRLDETEHCEYQWLALADAAEKVWSWTNREALRNLADSL